jgi:hypothetical protein
VLQSLVVYVLILPDVVDLPDDLAHEHLLGEEADQKHTDAQEGLRETTDVPHEGEDVIHLPRVHVVFLVTAQVDAHDVGVVVSQVVIVALNVLHLVEGEGGGLPDLQDAVLHGELLLLDEEVRHLPIERVNLEEKLVVYEIPDGFLIVILLEHAVYEGEAENLPVEVLVDLPLGLASHPRR